MVESIINSGLQGVQRGLESASKHAEQISTAFQNESDALEPAIALKQDKIQILASAKVIGVADKLSGSILDILA
jgi:hypothetical protein